MNTRLNQKRSSRLSLLCRMMMCTISTSHGSTCTRRAVGCVLTDDRDRVVATGYNGAPRGVRHCIDDGCLPGPDGGCIRAVHAELNACLQCSGDARTAYCTDQPCINCLKALMNKGVKHIFYWRAYEDKARDDFMASLPKIDTNFTNSIAVRAVAVDIVEFLNDYNALIESRYKCL